MPAVDTPGEADSGPYSEDGAGIQYAIPLRHNTGMCPNGCQ